MHPLAHPSPDTEAQLMTVLRALPAWRKLELARDMNRMADRLALAGLARRFPGMAADELAYRLAIQRLAPEQQPRGRARLEGVRLMTHPVDPLALALRVGTLLDHLGISYLVAGAVAAIVHGEYRMTRDLDLVLKLAPRHVVPLIAGLREQFTFLASDITSALERVEVARTDRQQRAGFCAYETTTGYQLDVYLATEHPFDELQLQRAVVIDIPGDPGGRLRVASAEDTVLAKLEWYTITPSERQWRDVQAVLGVQGAALDQDYLREWAEQLGLTPLLQRALTGQPPPPAADDVAQLPLL